MQYRLDITCTACYHIPVTKKKPSASHLAATLDRVEYSDSRGWNLFRPFFHLLNDDIRWREVRVIDENGQQLGIMSSREANALAQERHLDLVEISPQARPPVCKILDYGKYRYEQQKREKEARKNQKVFEIKEVKLRPGIEDHDFGVKFKNAARFLEDGNKVKVTIMFRGREMSHPELGEALLNKMAEELGDTAIVEKKPKIEGRNMTMVIAPKKK